MVFSTRQIAVRRPNVLPVRSEIRMTGSLKLVVLGSRGGTNTPAAVIIGDERRPFVYNLTPPEEG